MNRRKLLIGAGALAACAPARAPREAPTPAFPMRRGINLGNALEAPVEGEWGYWIERAHLQAIAAAGFDGVRVPVRWTSHLCAGDAICADFMARVREAIGWALEAGLKAQLNVHHYDALIAQPARERARFLSLWRQIGAAFADAPEALIFELLNEPHGPHWDGPLLAEMQGEALAAVRAENATRLVVLGPGNWQNIDALARWRPPPGRHIAVSVHYYEPWAFTHQRAEWLGADAPRFERAWGNGADLRAVAAHIGEAAAWGARHGYAMQLGEFGANARAPLAQRAAWTRAVREACEANAMAWCAWDFAGAFPLWDGGAWIEEMRAALL